MVHVIDHPIVQNELTILRNVATKSFNFRKSLKKITTFLLYEMMRNTRTTRMEVETSLGKSEGLVMDEIIFITVLRAGIPMLETALDIFPNAQGGFVGIKRDKESLYPIVYFVNLPNVTGDAFFLDPMVATAGTVVKAIKILCERGCKPKGIVSIISSRKAVEILTEKYPSVDIVTAAVDEKLNKNGYIVPGLGDCGDRYYGSEIG
ncbi:uracil phosphoribosyltransferase [candidate division WOR-3 bacterium]|nr:uracil phosphoribosyltransferase [candidate division WOR-3 bacterium]